MNYKIDRLIHNWSNARNEEVQWLPAFQPAATPTQQFLPRSINKAETVLLELFEHQILIKSLPIFD
jgi:hypothetical protein